MDEAIRELQGGPERPPQPVEIPALPGPLLQEPKQLEAGPPELRGVAAQSADERGDARKELYFQLAQGCAEAGDWQDAVNFATELANLDFGYRDISTLLDEWQERLSQGS